MIDEVEKALAGASSGTVFVAFHIVFGPRA
jgi:hypothetical protein